MAEGNIEDGFIPDSRTFLFEDGLSWHVLTQAVRYSGERDTINVQGATLPTLKLRNLWRP